jgi:hypothetical protein
MSNDSAARSSHAARSDASDSISADTERSVGRSKFQSVKLDITLTFWISAPKACERRRIGGITRVACAKHVRLMENPNLTADGSGSLMDFFSARDAKAVRFFGSLLF